MLGSLWRRAETPRVGVVVPLYNHARFIAEAVDSILAQGAAVAEIVVIDDGSTDNSAAVMERLSRRDRRIRFERQANQGAHATINTALARCSSEILAILNSDDAFLPGRLARLVAALDADDGADIAASGLQFMDGDGAAIRNEWHENALQFYRDTGHGGAGLAAALLNGNFVMTTSNLVFRRAMTERVGPFAALRYVHDLDWLLRALALGTAGAAGGRAPAALPGPRQQHHRRGPRRRARRVGDGRSRFPRHVVGPAGRPADRLEPGRVGAAGAAPA